MSFAYARKAATSIITPPDDWPYGWDYPAGEDGPWPPGWPTTLDATFTLFLELPFESRVTDDSWPYTIDVAAGSADSATLLDGQTFRIDLTGGTNHTKTVIARVNKTTTTDLQATGTVDPDLVEGVDDNILVLGTCSAHSFDSVVEATDSVAIYPNNPCSGLASLGYETPTSLTVTIRGNGIASNEWYNGVSLPQDQNNPCEYEGTFVAVAGKLDTPFSIEGATYKIRLKFGGVGSPAIWGSALTSEDVVLQHYGSQGTDLESDVTLGGNVVYGYDKLTVTGFNGF